MSKFTGKTFRLLTMLGLTVAFFFVEIVVGYMTNSMALVADSFHMLSDVLALLIGFFAVRISRRRSKKNTFGWARAEVLGALVNAVFLVALCFSILIEALKRVIVVERIDNVNLMLWVGSLGLVVNLIGLALFHDHSHGHAHHHHGSHSSPSGGGGSFSSSVSKGIDGEKGGGIHHHYPAGRGSGKSLTDKFGGSSSVVASTEDKSVILASSRERLGSFDKLNMSGAKYIEAATEPDEDEYEEDPEGDYDYRTVSEDLEDNNVADELEKGRKLPKTTVLNGSIPTAASPILNDSSSLPLDKVVVIGTDPTTLPPENSSNKRFNASVVKFVTPSFSTPEKSALVRVKSNRASHPKIAQPHHLNMHGVFLHVLGDALGSIIVIISALSIKYFKGDWKYYMDPGMSLLLVIIILSTTAPLLKESALILLQTVPPHIRIDELRDRLMDIDGILAVHEFHVWQLAGTRIIATAHIRCRNIMDYMKIAGKVKEFFHKEGIHSTTIQPEFVEAPGEEEKCLLLCQGPLDCAPKTCCGKNQRLLALSSTDEGGGINNPGVIPENSVAFAYATPNGYDDSQPIKVIMKSTGLNHAPTYPPPRQQLLNQHPILPPFRVPGLNSESTTNNNHSFNHVTAAESAAQKTFVNSLDPFHYKNNSSLNSTNNTQMAQISTTPSASNTLPPSSKAVPPPPPRN